MRESVGSEEIAVLVMPYRKRNRNPWEQRKTDNNHAEDERGQPESLVLADFPKPNLCILKQRWAISNEGDG